LSDRPPELRDDWALFLDIDGTMLDIAQKPGAVTVPPDLPNVLNAVSRRLSGALAIVTGRPLADIDRLLSPLTLPSAAEHGAIIRHSDGTVDEPDESFSVPRVWRERIREAARDWPGVLVQDKRFGLAIHYRLAPEREEEITALVRNVVAEDPHFEAMPARMAFELRHRDLHKGEGLQALMRHQPFTGRVPVFVGDDVTDEDGFRAARAMGGLGLHVNEVFGGQPANVRRWLRAIGDKMGT
jgi:trehalose 6-phosphate phosphatase